MSTLERAFIEIFNSVHPSKEPLNEVSHLLNPFDPFYLPNGRCKIKKFETATSYELYFVVLRVLLECFRVCLVNVASLLRLNLDGHYLIIFYKEERASRRREFGRCKATLKSSIGAARTM